MPTPDQPPPLGPDDLAEIGRALYGERWQSDMARSLDLGDSARIRQFVRGDRKISDGIWRDLLALLRSRADECRDAAAKLARRLA